jgi:hypothetical protein
MHWEVELWPRSNLFKFKGKKNGNSCQHLGDFARLYRLEKPVLIKLVNCD